MPLIRRRPLMRAAMVGGTAYAAGKHSQRNAQREASQDEQIDQLQQAPPPPPPAYAPPPSEYASPRPEAAAPPVDPVTALTQLKELLDAGVLTQEEFAAQKQRILAGA